MPGEFFLNECTETLISDTPQDDMHFDETDRSTTRDDASNNQSDPLFRNTANESPVGSSILIPSIEYSEVELSILRSFGKGKKNVGVWQYFYDCDEDSPKCKLCLKHIKRNKNTTSNLTSHLKNLHKDIFDMVCEKLQGTSASECDKSLKQTKINLAMDKATFTEKGFVARLVKLCVLSTLAFKVSLFYDFCV
jgi:hypothetical protein